MSDPNLMKGWFGEERQLLSVLDVHGAEKDDDGKYLIFGKAPAVGFDGGIVVPNEMKCRINGKEVFVAPLMEATSYGMSVAVIM